MDLSIQKVGEIDSLLNLQYVFSDETLLSKLLCRICFDLGVEGGEGWGREKEGMKVCLRERHIPVNTHFVNICDVAANPGEVLARTWSVPAEAGHQPLGALSEEGLMYLGPGLD